MGRGGEPLLDPRLLTETAGYASGAALGTVYFVGFSGIWLVFALFFQTGLGYTPLQSGLAVTPFALGSAVSAVFGGRLVDRFGRRLTVIGLGWSCCWVIAAAAVLLRLAPSVGLLGSRRPRRSWSPASAAAWVVSPNITMTLRVRPGADGGFGRRGAADRAADRVRRSARPPCARCSTGCWRLRRNTSGRRSPPPSRVARRVAAAASPCSSGDRVRRIARRRRRPASGYPDRSPRVGRRGPGVGEEVAPAAAGGSPPRPPAASCA